MAVPDRQLKPDTYRSEQNVQNWSFDEIYKVLATIPVIEYNNALYRLQGNSDGTLAVGAKDAIERYDYSSSTTIYVGTAAPGTSASTATWTIYKYDLSSSSNASGLKATNIAWNNRTSGSYA